MSGGALTPYHHPSSFIGSPKDKSNRPSSKEEDKNQSPNGPNVSSPVSSGSHHGRQSRKRLVFADPVAFRYLEEDPAPDAIERWRRLKGYEMYLVEQWACS